MKKKPHPVLRKTGISIRILKLIPIPAGIIIAKLMAKTVDDAVNGNIRKIINSFIIVLLIIIGIRIFTIITNIVLEEAMMKATHKCKRILYHPFMSNPIYKLYDIKYGDVIENLNDDFLILKDNHEYID